ncbi:ROK family protein [Anaerobium acetethylicum]|uniref:Sugar kinase of the NBD/HSP70 family, may contain an N-terminal HTH domain n=1 Tax=Anaerobium acetethylicum TaxID=1619234 RepID=A0A1D3TXZ6_9FIRM|nr:ROK family protein [Anaerobium acetethylicum]SCP99264.1 Sugar kinase of the NBD/HSP70 family, may contain an N-terminal HTH domain [Anaerobium acetethylicum]
MGRNNIEVKKMNRNSIYTYILKGSVVSKHEIAQSLQLSIPTVAQGLQDLQELSLVTEEGMLNSTGGRKAKGYMCIRDAKVAIGMDITENHISLVMLDLAGQIILSKRKRIEVHDDEKFYLALKNEVEELIENSGINRDRILGMGISLPAIVDETGQKIYALYEKMSISKEFYHIMTQYFEFPIILTNDANSSGKAELGLRGDYENSVYFSLSHTMGGAIFINGQLFGGNDQRGGEIGHMTLIPGGRQCYCGRKGCADAYCASKVLSDAVNGSIEDFFKQLEQGDEHCKQVWNEYLDYLALEVHNLHIVFDCYIVIGGYVGQYINHYIHDLRRRVQKIDTYIEDASFLQASALKYEAPAIGAASVFIEQFKEQV